MTFAEVMAFYDYKMSNIARTLNLSRPTVTNWKNLNKIPYVYQCEIEVLTYGKLKAQKEES